MEKVNLEIDAPDRTISAVVLAPFDIAKRALEQEGYEVISFTESALLRFQTLNDHIEFNKSLIEARSIFRFMPSSISHGHYVREGVVYVPGDGRYITKKSPAMKRPEEFAAAKKVRRPFFITKSELEEALSDSVKVPYEFPYKISEKKFEGDRDRIPIENLKNDEVMSFCFSPWINYLEEVLRKAGQESIPVLLNEENYVNDQEQPFAEQLSFGGLVNYSSIWVSSGPVRGYLNGGRRKVVELKR